MRRIIIIAVIIIASLFAAVPAFASGPGTQSGCGTDTNSDSCSSTVNGGFTVTQVLGLEVSIPPFTVEPPSAPGQIGGVFVLSNDPNGYFVDETSTAFTGPSTVPASAVSTSMWGDGPFSPGGQSATISYAPLGGTVAFCGDTDALTGGIDQGYGGTIPSGYDAYGVAQFMFNSSATVYPAGTYAGSVTFTLWGN